MASGAIPRAAIPRLSRRPPPPPRRRAPSPPRRLRAPGEKTLLDVAAAAPGAFALIPRALGLHYGRPLRATCTALRAAVDGKAEGVHLTFAASMRGAARRCTGARRLGLFARVCFLLDVAAAAGLFSLGAPRVPHLDQRGRGPPPRRRGARGGRAARGASRASARCAWATAR